MRLYGSCDGVILRLFYDITSVIIFLSVSLSQVIALIVYKKLYTDSKILISWKIALIHLLARSHLWHGVRFQTIKR